MFESGAILVYLAEKFGAFLPTERAKRAECLSWLFWQMGSAPFLGGGFGHFYAYAPVKIEYAIDRYAMETKRQLDVLNRRLAETRYIAGDDYTIADMAIFPWYGGTVKGWSYGAGEFLGVHEYTHVIRWADALLGASGGQARPHGQPHARRSRHAVARAPRGQRFRDQDGRQAHGRIVAPRAPRKKSIPPPQNLLCRNRPARLRSSPHQGTS